jgi:predicted dehydrogenase
MLQPTRRSFLAGAAAAARVPGANNRINLGFIDSAGAGGHLRALTAQSEQKADVQVLAVCDVYARHRDKARQTAHLESKDVYNDYRELLARGDIDAVVISTPDHWHAPMAIDAMAAGKDVYLEKPMTLTIDERAS